MTPNPAIGILLHAIGGFAAGSFYSPPKKIRGWSWETAWLMMGLAAWLAAPWFASWRTTPQLGDVLSQAWSTEYRAVALAVFFGFVWGFGNLTYGMANRYLGIALGKPIAELSIAHGANPLYSINVVLIAVLTGGFLSNGLSCIVMNLRNQSMGDYVRFDASYLPNALLAWLSGVTWFCQFFFYGMGQTKLGKQFEFSSWSIHMAFIVIFLNLWGIAFHEWHGTTRITKTLVWLGILILIGSTNVIRY